MCQLNKRQALTNWGALVTGMCVQDRTVRLSSVFDKLTYWNLETPPNSDDTVVMAMDWPELADAVSVYIVFNYLCGVLIHWFFKKGNCNIPAADNFCHINITYVKIKYTASFVAFSHNRVHMLVVKNWVANLCCSTVFIVSPQFYKYCQKGQKSWHWQSISYITF